MAVFLPLTWIADFLRAFTYLFCLDTESSVRIVCVVRFSCGHSAARVDRTFACHGSACFRASVCCFLMSGWLVTVPYQLLSPVR